MTLTLLIDLDDTLLTNPIATFLPAYLNALGKHMTGFVPPEQMVKNLLTATEVMIANNQTGLSLERSFDRSFYPAIGHTKEDLRTTLEEFYDQVFPTLQSFTHQLPDALKFVNWALHQGHTLVIATNPLFPRKAVLHRLRWAGLDPDLIPFAMITTYERFHFAKPNPAYFAEILAQLGWPNQPAVVIGNSLEDDIIPAAKLGLPAFWACNPPAHPPEDLSRLSASGTLADLPDWLQQVDSSGLRMEFRTPPALLSVLKSTPAAFDSFTMGLSDRQWQQRPAPDEWSVTEIICHLRDADRDVNIPRLEKVFAGNNPFIAGIDTDSWAEERDYYHQDGRTAFEEFIEVRAQLIARLEAIDEEDWMRPARHAIFGPTTIRELTSFTAIHDQSHIQQALAAIRGLA